MAAPSELGNSDSEDELESLSQILRHLEHSGSPRQHLRVCTHALTLWMIDDDDGGSVYCSLGGVGPDRGLWGGGRRGWREEWARRLGRSYFFISLVLGPLNSLVWYVPSLRYTRGLGWRIHCGVEVTESSYDSSTNKQHISIETYSFHRRTIIHALHFDYDLQTQAQAQRRIAEADCR
jgi:hypothetical protein